MSWVCKFPAFATTLLLLGLLVLAESVGLGERVAAAREARKRLDHARREWRELTNRQPAPTSENMALIAADLDGITRALADLRAELTPAGPLAARFVVTPEPMRRPEAFFDLAAFIEAMRARAQRAGVGLQPEERFGFSAYAHEAPESGRLTAVYRERLMLQGLLEALLDAQPHQLLSVQRERPREMSAPNAKAKPGSAPEGNSAGSGAADYFEPDPRLSARMPGFIETTAFRLTFTGHTAVLRAFLNQLAEFEMPVVVRSVEIAPSDHPAGTAPAQPGPAPLVAPAWSRFIVTVEFFALVPPVAPAF